MTGIATALRAAMPALAVIDDAAQCAVLSGDIAAPAPAPAAAIVRPDSADAVAALVRWARSEGAALYPRGGGWSYTAGYQSSDRPGILVDSTLLQGIAIDLARDCVTAGAGVTWSALYDALEAAGLRAPSFGPLSGIGATLGGGAAQNGGFFGAAGHGAFGDGSIVGGAMVDGTATPQHLGLDDRVAGNLVPQPLVGDCGAFGIRTAVTVRTLKRPEVTAFASFNFQAGEHAIAVLARLAGLPNLGEAYVFDPGTHANLARTGFSVIESAGFATDLLRAKGGLFSKLGGLLRTARAGKAFVADLAWSLHLSFDGTQEEVDHALQTATDHALELDGEVIPDVIPRVTRARPFRRIKALLGPDGERWLPLHGVFPAAGAMEGFERVQQALAAAGPPGLRTIILAVLVGERIIIEPQLFWPDALSIVHRHMVTADQLAAFGERPGNPDVRTAALALRRSLLSVLDAAGASHFQIGRSYAGHPGTPPGTLEAWQSLKRRYDPDRIVNPGVLGL